MGIPDPNLILAGTGDPSLTFWAPTETALPTDATTALAAAYLDGGYIAESGADISRNTETVEIDAYGTFAPVRTLVTKETTSFGLSFRESNLVSLSVYNRLPLTGDDALTATTAGAVDVTDGPARDLTYVCVIDSLDGLNKVRKVFPRVRVTGRMNEQIAKAQNIAYGVTLTAEPDSNNISSYSYYILDALKTV